MRRGVLLFLATCTSVLQGAEPCRILVVDKENGWPVPLVELRTTHNVRLVTDNAGVIALDLPEVMNRECWFDVIGHGYTLPKDGFGYRGVRLTPQSGKSLKVEVKREIIAKRLGRLTGGGIFAESQRLGTALDWVESGEFGCDSTQVAVHRGNIFWLWGDTTLPHYPLGVFHVTGAQTALRPFGNLMPPLRVVYDYFRDDHARPRAIAKLPGDGPTWLFGLVSLPDQNGVTHLCASYNKVKPPLEVYESGLCVWSEERQNFERLHVVWRQGEHGGVRPTMPDGHAVLWQETQGHSWVLFGDPFPRLRCAATFEAWQDPTAWERLVPQPELVAADDGGKVKPHTGSIAWSRHRGRWVTIFMQAFGKPSVFGELWYAEAATPTGPWGRAVKVLSHENYTFYNPLLHPEALPEDTSVLLFEGTFTKQFTDQPVAVPRYDYAQIVYRIDLDDPALVPAHSAGGD